MNASSQRHKDTKKNTAASSVIAGSSRGI